MLSKQQYTAVVLNNRKISVTINTPHSVANVELLTLEYTSELEWI